MLPFLKRVSITWVTGNRRRRADSTFLRAKGVSDISTAGCSSKSSSITLTKKGNRRKL